MTNNSSTRFQPLPAKVCEAWEAGRKLEAQIKEVGLREWAKAAGLTMWEARRVREQLETNGNLQRDPWKYRSHHFTVRPCKLRTRRTA